MGGVGAGGDFLHCILKLKIHFSCLSVRLYPMNVKTAEHMPPAKGYGSQKLQKIVAKRFWKCAKKYYLISKFLFLFYIVEREDDHRFSHS